VLVSALIAIATSVAGCETTSTVTTGPTPPKCQLTLAAPANIVADGGTGAITVTAQPECAWTVTTPANWISNLSPTSGQGNGEVEFLVAANPAPTIREGEIVVNDDRVRVMQEAALCRFTIAPGSQAVTADAGNASITVSAPTGCTWAARSDVPWITITSSASGDGDGTVAFRVAANTGGTRTGTLTIADRTHTVTQQEAGPPSPPPPSVPSCTYAISPTNQLVAAGGGPTNPVTVTAVAGCLWTAISNEPWITVSSGASGNGNGAVWLSFAANPGGVRSGTVTIAGHTFTATQAAPAPVQCTYEIDPRSASVPALGATALTISVGTPPGCAWTATNSASWISFTTASSGSGSGKVGVLVLPNPDSAARSGDIVVAGQTFTVSQAGIGGQTSSTSQGP
jgi:hypothetical protein